MSCLGDDLLLAYVESRLSTEERTRVQQHLDDCATCRTLLSDIAKAGSIDKNQQLSDLRVAAEDREALESAATQQGLPPSETAPLLTPLLGPGVRVDHFEVVHMVGQGGMGEVYLARDVKLGRKVALKVVRRESIGSQEAIDRFLFEARTTAQFNHPHIVTIHAVGEYQGCPYMALEYIEGKTLRQHMDQGPLDLKESLRIGLSIAEALAEAHRHQVLHRDLKPQNVLLAKDGRLRVWSDADPEFDTARKARALAASLRTSQ